MSILKDVIVLAVMLKKTHKNKTRQRKNATKKKKKDQNKETQVINQPKAYLTDNLKPLSQPFLPLVSRTLELHVEENIIKYM